MANIFKAQQQVNDHPNRNNFDLSKKSNVSLKFGTLYPVYCQPVVPGDSFSIDTAFNLKLMPVVFPVQTKMRAHMHYFYVRNKNLWSNWENWISNLVSQSDHPHPYLAVNDGEYKSGSIHDFLGVPTSAISKKDIFNTFTGVYYDHAGDYAQYYASDISIRTGGDLLFDETFDTGSYVLSGFGLELNSPMNIFYSDFKIILSNGCLFSTGATSQAVTLIVGSGDPADGGFNVIFSVQEDVSKRQVKGVSHHIHHFDTSSFRNNPDVMDLINNTGDLVFMFAYNPASVHSPYTIGDASVSVMVSDVGFVQYSELSQDLYTNGLHINALPYRAYESIYYAYYNNNVLNPLTINGQVQYNRYNTELGDGADATNYHLFQRNYELDFLTSALPSPQQGVAPVVGMTALGDVTIEDENGITTAHAEVDNDGTITKVVLTSPAASNEHARTAMNIAACGMSINDFRSTNALQRVLETNIRKGYRYMDFIAGHFGKEPEYRELDMPEFIGGFSRDVSVSTVVSNADTLASDTGAALGEYGGYAQVVGGSNHSVRHYCDDYGYIIGILSVVPTPCYSQLLPKHMIAPDNFLDYYFPEMAQLGLQPITYKEVSPIQCYLDSLSDPTKSLEDTFGYQRPNYDMVSAVDELHGEFRGSLRNYVINRIFDVRPELGQSFISINPSEINDIFVNTNPDDDTILGEIGFSVHAKRPVPRVVIPNLGR